MAHTLNAKPRSCLLARQLLYCMCAWLPVVLQDELADMADLTNEINEAMGQSYAIPDDVDEADLMAELDALEGDLALEDAVGASGPSYLQVRRLLSIALLGVCAAVVAGSVVALWCVAVRGAVLR
jgi:hypothetical protein